MGCAAAPELLIEATKTGNSAANQDLEVNDPQIPKLGRVLTPRFWDLTLVTLVFLTVGHCPGLSCWQWLEHSVMYPIIRLCDSRLLGPVCQIVSCSFLELLLTFRRSLLARSGPGEYLLEYACGRSAFSSGYCQMVQL